MQAPEYFGKLAPVLYAKQNLNRSENVI